MNSEDEAQFKFICDTLKEVPDIFMDFGPGHLLSEAWYAKKQWPNCKIVGVEACENRYNKIKAEYPGNLIFGAISDTVATMIGWEGGKYDMFMRNRINAIRSSYNIYREVKRRTTTADTLFCENASSGKDKVFIWCDIEGMELIMLSGAREMLANGNIIGLNLEMLPKNFTQIWPYRKPEETCTADQISDFLAGYGFRNIGSMHANVPRDIHLTPNPTYEGKEWFGDFLFMPRPK